MCNWQLIYILSQREKQIVLVLAFAAFAYAKKKSHICIQIFYSRWFKYIQGWNCNKIKIMAYNKQGTKQKTWDRIGDIDVDVVN